MPLVDWNPCRSVSSTILSVEIKHKSFTTPKVPNSIKYCTFGIISIVRIFGLKK